jgi:hypothetical protein
MNQKSSGYHQLFLEQASDFQLKTYREKQNLVHKDQFYGQEERIIKTGNG